MINIETLKSIFLLFLVVSGNYVGELLGCKTRGIFTNNIYTKHLIIIFLIYFTLDFIEKKKKHPIDILKKTIIIWILFIVSTKTYYIFTFMFILFLFCLYVIDEYEVYLKENNIKYNKNNIDKTRTYLEYLSFIMLIIGFVIYFIKQKKEKKNFSYLKFFFWTVTCKNK